MDEHLERLREAYATDNSDEIRYIANEILDLVRQGSASHYTITEPQLSAMLIMSRGYGYKCITGKSHTIKVDSVTLSWVCPECGYKSATPLGWIQENGTVTCECGTDCVLTDTIDVANDPVSDHNKYNK